MLLSLPQPLKQKTTFSRVVETGNTYSKGDNFKKKKTNKKKLQEICLQWSVLRSHNSIECPQDDNIHSTGVIFNGYLLAKQDGLLARNPWNMLCSGSAVPHLVACKANANLIFHLTVSEVLSCCVS